MNLGRIIEDLYVLGRFGYFYHKADRDIASVGFVPSELPKRDKIRYAWNRATGR
jgi:hypothetical protein